MKQMWKKLRTWAIVMSCCLLALGILLLIWPEISAVAVCCVLGVICVLYGIYETIQYFKLGLVGFFFRFDLALGISNILIGVLLLLHPLDSVVFLPIMAGMFMIFGSVFDIQLSVEMQRVHLGNWVATLIMGIVNAAFAVFLILDPFQGASALMAYIGICLILRSIDVFYLIYCVSKAIRNSKKDDIIDIEWTSI